MHAMYWNVFCRVVDNYGDIGVCWRLAADLAERGHVVCLWTDDASALDWMAPQRPSGITVRPWPDPGTPFVPGDVVIEAFGCSLPDHVLQAMAADHDAAPAWINLEYLSAESHAERSHGLPSPVAHGPGAGLRKHFFFPGFTARTGGLLREPGLARRRGDFDAPAWLDARGLARTPGQRLASLFCYTNDALPAWFASLAEAAQPTRVLLTPGPATAQAADWLGQPLPAGAQARRGTLEVHALPWLSQHEYDHLLWACDLNLVRGEDTLVRALWAGRPLLWQLYPQHDGAHRTKLDAFLAWGWPGQAATPGLQACWRAWNGLVPADALDWEPLWSQPPPAVAGLWSQPDLVHRLEVFVAAMYAPRR